MRPGSTHWAVPRSATGARPRAVDQLDRGYRGRADAAPVVHGRLLQHRSERRHRQHLGGRPDRAPRRVPGQRQHHGRPGRGRGSRARSIRSSRARAPLPQFIQFSFQNADTEKVEGFDFGIEWRHEFGAIDFSTSFEATYLMKYEVIRKDGTVERL
jgi:hypothetical protein